MGKNKSKRQDADKNAGQDRNWNGVGKRTWYDEEFAQKAGTRFEKEFRDNATKYAQNNRGMAIEQYDEDEDHKNGTDIMFTGPGGYRLRLDPTSFFTHKDNMPLVVRPEVYKEKSGGAQLTLNGKPVWFGIRTANNHAGFQEHVVVVGVDMKAGDCHRFLNSLKENPIPGMMAKIMTFAKEVDHAYKLATDPSYQSHMPKRRREEAVSILSPNPWFAKQAQKVLSGEEPMPERSGIHARSIELYLERSKSGNDIVTELLDAYGGPETQAEREARGIPADSELTPAMKQMLASMPGGDSDDEPNGPGTKYD